MAVTKKKNPALFSLKNARSKKQHDHMARNAAKGRCCFCDIDWKVNRELRRGKFWRVMPNAFPYRAHRNHIILTPIRHVTDINQLTPAEWVEWTQLNKWAIKKFNIPGGAIVMRFGKFGYNAGTVAHFHTHIQVPNRRRFAIAVFYKDEALEKFLAAMDKKDDAVKAKRKKKKN